jgi:hypothetical protein
MTSEQFLEHIRPELEAQDISINIAEVLGGFGGWFSEEDRELCVWKHNPVFFETLVHEYCHFLQYRDKYDFWTKHNTHTDALFSWLNGEIELKPHSKKVNTHGAIAIEWDCEQMSLKYIKEYNLPIDHEFYSRSASAYIFSYYTTAEARKWPVASLYTPEVIENSPELRELDFYLNKRNLSKKLKNALQQKYK